MKSKATQAANDTLGTEERAFIASQISSLATEITALANQTVYQGNSLLSGTYNATFQVGERTADVINVRLLSGGVGNAFTAAGLGVNSLSVNTNANAIASMDLIDRAITSVASAVNQLGIYQTQLSIREEILTQAINSNSAARSRIRDADFAKEQSEYIKLQILQQTAIAALSQANVAPESVLGFLRR
jgi:flagellin